MPPITTEYQDIEIIKGSGFIYRFYTRFPAMKMQKFNYGLVTAAKKELYNAMIENGEIDQPVGFHMVSSSLARSWVFRDGFESPNILEYLCAWIVEPLDKENAPPVLDALLEADELSQGLWEGEPITAETPKNLGQLLHFIIERDLSGRAGMKLLKLFFIRLITPPARTTEPTTNSTQPSPEAGMEEKAS